MASSSRDCTSVVVLCHGRAHYRISGIDYKNTIFIDIDEEAKPDLMINISEVDLPATHAVPKIMLVGCPIYMYATITNVTESGMTLAASLKKRIFKNIKNLLAVDGELLVGCSLYTPLENGGYTPNLLKCIKTFESEGFKFIEQRRVNYTKMMVFKMTA